MSFERKIGKTALWFDRAKNLLTKIENSDHIFVVNAYIYVNERGQNKHKGDNVLIKRERIRIIKKVSSSNNKEFGEP